MGAKGRISSVPRKPITCRSRPIADVARATFEAPCLSSLTRSPSWCRSTAGQLAPAYLEAWREQWRTLRARLQTRLLQRRFRRNPGKYLTELEGRLLRLDLPPSKTGAEAPVCRTINQSRRD